MAWAFSLSVFTFFSCPSSFSKTHWIFLCFRYHEPLHWRLLWARGECPTFTDLGFLIQEKERKSKRLLLRLLYLTFGSIWKINVFLDNVLKWRQENVQEKKKVQERGIFFFFSVSFPQLIHQTSLCGVQDEKGSLSELVL